MKVEKKKKLFNQEARLYISFHKFFSTNMFEH